MINIAGICPGHSLTIDDTKGLVTDRVTQFVRNSQLCHYQSHNITKSLPLSLSLSLVLSLSVELTWTANDTLITIIMIIITIITISTCRALELWGRTVGLSSPSENKIKSFFSKKKSNWSQNQIYGQTWNMKHENRKQVKDSVNVRRSFSLGLWFLAPQVL